MQLSMHKMKKKKLRKKKEKSLRSFCQADMCTILAGAGRDMM